MTPKAKFPLFSLTIDKLLAALKAARVENNDFINHDIVTFS